ncbi:MAG: 4-(cytidine 5'-diphospho)-2-C-methyl-D-erythritol kinase [Candidatus Gastranaerophilales bacterium]|nr:4-(cytidine 5'-diphospho)-2-C-methyl-D-erythritol kinase [Candidatus Gastranaerophilales bacterium]
MKKIKVKAPAKINLTLEVLNKREDGFHNLQSIMQAVDLYDYLTVEVDENETGINIILTGNSIEIPYNEHNLVFKAAHKYFEKAGIKNIYLKVNIEKNIPVAAGLAGGSTDGAAVLYALNKLLNSLSDDEIDGICASLGSDLNFCLKGGCALCTSRGEKIEAIPFVQFDVSLVKPCKFGISAKEAYTKFAQLKDKTSPDNTHKMLEKLKKGEFDASLLYNSLENAVINDYEELQFMKKSVKGSMMSGSGPTFFVVKKRINYEFDTEKFIVINGLKSINTGVEVC